MLMRHSPFFRHANIQIMNAAIEDLETVLVAAGRLVAYGKPGALVRLYRPALNDYATLRLRQGDTPAEIVARLRTLYAEAVCSVQMGNTSLTIHQMRDFIQREVYQCKVSS